jgi:hypothetical protein
VRFRDYSDAMLHELDHGTDIVESRNSLVSPHGVDVTSTNNLCAREGTNLSTILTDPRSPKRAAARIEAIGSPTPPAIGSPTPPNDTSLHVEKSSASSCACEFVKRQTTLKMVALANPAGTTPVDRRWQVAIAIIQGNAPRRFFHRVDDEFVDRVIRYLAAWQRCHGVRDESRVANEMPHVHQARLLRIGPFQPRAVVEARLLAGQSIDEVAAACQLSEETVRHYESLFFAVAGKLCHRFPIMNAAIGSKCRADLLEEETDVLIKLGGFHGGVPMIEAMLDYYSFDWTMLARVDSLTVQELTQLDAVLDTELFVLSTISALKKTRFRHALAAKRRVHKRIWKMLRQSNEAREWLAARSWSPAIHVDDPEFAFWYAALGVGKTTKTRRQKTEPAVLHEVDGSLGAPMPEA